MSKPDIGFIGIGVMGSRMATNLLNAGYEVTVFDLDQTRVEKMLEKGAESADTASDLAHQSDVVMSSLPTIDAVESAYHGNEGVLEGADADTLIVELSTITPNTTKGIASAASSSIEIIDAPVIGLPNNAKEATLTIVVGGTDRAFEKGKPILENIGNNIQHVGSLGEGNAIKLVNNVMAYGNFAVAAEAFTLGKQLGLDQSDLLDIVQSGGASSFIVGAKMPKALSGEFSPGFNVQGVRKDVKYALETGYEADVALPLTAGIMEQYGLAAGATQGDKDFSILMKVLDEMQEDR